MVAIALVGLVLLQRSEGGALGIGGGGGGFMTGRSAGNALTKSTAVLAACFFATSLALSILGRPSASRADHHPGRRRWRSRIGAAPDPRHTGSRQPASSSSPRRAASATVAIA